MLKVPVSCPVCKNVLTVSKHKGVPGGMISCCNQDAHKIYYEYHASGTKCIALRLEL